MPLMSRAEIVAHPLYPAIERQIAQHLIGIHMRTPRMSRLKASHRKWLMTQSVFALALRRTPELSHRMTSFTTAGAPIA